MQTKVCYIPAIKLPHLVDVPNGRIVSIMGNGVCYSSRSVQELEVKVYYRRLFVKLLELRAMKLRRKRDE